MIAEDEILPVQPEQPVMNIFKKKLCRCGHFVPHSTCCKSGSGKNGQRAKSGRGPHHVTKRHRTDSHVSSLWLWSAAADAAADAADYPVVRHAAPLIIQPPGDLGFQD